LNNLAQVQRFAIMAVGVSTAPGSKMALHLIIGEIDQEIDDGIVHKSSVEIANVPAIRKGWTKPSMEERLLEGTSFSFNFEKHHSI
jgi:hypothetical protein